MDLDKLTYTLPEVSDLTGFPLGPLQEDCRRKRVEHIHSNRERFMTPAQIEALLAKRTVKADPRAGEPASRPADVDEIAVYAEKVGRRLGRKSARRAA
jgi:hypothetical protein